MRDELTAEEFAALGKQCREARDGNLVVGSFAAELIGEGYPLSKALWDVVFNLHDDEQLGRKFVDWSDQ